MSTDYDPRYPFGKPSDNMSKKPVDETKSKAQAYDGAKADDKSHKKTQTKSVKGKGGFPVLKTMLILGALAASYYGYNWYQDIQQKEEAVNQIRLSEPALHCPAYQKGTINSTLEEREAYAYLIGGLDAHDVFPEELKKAIVRETLVGLESGMGKAEAFAYAEKSLFEGIVQDANTAVFKKGQTGHRVGSGLSRLEKNFPTPVAVQTRDVPRILKAIPFCLESLKANLDAYSPAEAQVMLETFGSMLVHPELGREAAKTAGKNQEWTAMSQADVIRETTQRLSGDVAPHDALCHAVNVVFRDANSPIAFYTYAQAARIMHGKNQLQMENALNENLEQIQSYPEGWVGKNTGWLVAKGAHKVVAPKTKDSGR